MTDYLEQLLEGQEQEEPGQELEWGRVALPPRTRQTREREQVPDGQPLPELWEEFARQKEGVLPRSRDGYDEGRAVRPAPVSGMDTQRDTELEEEADMGPAPEMRVGTGFGRAEVGTADRIGQETAGQEAGLVLDAVSGRNAARRIGLESALAAGSRLGTQPDAEQEARLAVDLSVGTAGRNRSNTLPLTVALTRLHRAARQAGAQAGRRNGWDTQSAGERAGTARMSGSAQNGAVDVAALVDAAFARDARRYDGPLGLL